MFKKFNIRNNSKQNNKCVCMRGTFLVYVATAIVAKYL